MPFAVKSSACDLFIFLYSAIPTGALPMRGYGGWGGARVGAGGLEGDVGRSDLCSGGGGWSELSSGAAVGLGLGRVVVCSAFSSGSALLGPMRLRCGIDSEGRGDSARVCFGMSKNGSPRWLCRCQDRRNALDVAVVVPENHTCRLIGFEHPRHRRLHRFHKLFVHIN